FKVTDIVNGDAVPIDVSMGEHGDFRFPIAILSRLNREPPADDYEKYKRHRDSRPKAWTNEEPRDDNAEQPSRGGCGADARPCGKIKKKRAGRPQSNEHRDQR